MNKTVVVDGNECHSKMYPKDEWVHTPHSPLQASSGGVGWGRKAYSVRLKYATPAGKQRPGDEL